MTDETQNKPNPDAETSTDADPDTSERETGDAAERAEANSDSANVSTETASEPADPVTELETELAQTKEALLRTAAELENTRKRAERQVSDARVYAVEKFAGDLLSVSDNLARALQALSDEDRAALSEAGRNLLGGIEMTQKELHKVFARHNLVPIDAEPGTAFDPNVHQAVSQVPSEQPNGTVAETYQSGWRIGDRVLRAAMVAVSAGPAN